MGTNIIDEPGPKIFIDHFNRLLIPKELLLWSFFKVREACKPSQLALEMLLEDWNHWDASSLSLTISLNEQIYWMGLECKVDEEAYPLFTSPHPTDAYLKDIAKSFLTSNSKELRKVAKEALEK